MKTTVIEDGTWTLNVVHKSGSVWKGWIVRSAVLHPRFQRARFTAHGEKPVLIAADQLRDAVKDWLGEPNGFERLPFKMNLESSTFNGIPVEMHREG